MNTTQESSLGNTYLLDKERNFSIVLGGPFYQLLRRTHLDGDAPKLLLHRITIFVLLTWLPLLLLSASQDLAWGDRVHLPFLYDLEMHTRLLVSLPLLVLSEVVVNLRLSPIVCQFLERGLVHESDRVKFDSAIDSAIRLRNSFAAESALILFVYIFGVGYLWRTQLTIDVPSWFGIAGGEKVDLSLAGWWLKLVSLPFFQFLLLRWYFRLFIWARFLWQVSRIKLDLMPMHPDRCGGLGFLSSITYAFATLLFAQGTMLAGMIANRIFFTEAKLLDFKLEALGMVFLMVFSILGPLVVFLPELERARRKGGRELGALAYRYAHEFDKKWLKGANSKKEPLLGSPDIQSLADIGNSLAVVQQMKLVPFTTQAVLSLIIATLLPSCPLLLTMFSFEELLENLFKMVF